MVILAAVFVWSDLALVGIVLIVLALLVVVIDSWANRPIRKSEPRYRDDR